MKILKYWPLVAYITLSILVEHRVIPLPPKRGSLDPLMAYLKESLYKEGAGPLDLALILGPWFGIAAARPPRDLYFLIKSFGLQHLFVPSALHFHFLFFPLRALKLKKSKTVFLLINAAIYYLLLNSLPHYISLRRPALIAILKTFNLDINKILSLMILFDVLTSAYTNSPLSCLLSWTFYTLILLKTDDESFSSVILKAQFICGLILGQLQGPLGFLSLVISPLFIVMVLPLGSIALIDYSLWPSNYIETLINLLTELLKNFGLQ